MEAPDFGALVETLRDAARAETVYGDPIERGDRTVVPVARVAFGWGGGGGSGPEEDDDAGEGWGGGGGLQASPVGALEVTDHDTRFVRYDGRKRTVALVLVGLALGYLLGRR